MFSAQQSLDLIQRALGKDHAEDANKARDIIALNAGAAIYAADIAQTTLKGGWRWLRCDRVRPCPGQAEGTGQLYPPPARRRPL